MNEENLNGIFQLDQAHRRRMHIVLCSHRRACCANALGEHGLGAGLATVDVATGATSFIGGTSISLTDIAFSPSGDLYGISFSSLYKVNSSNGATTLVGGLGAVSGTANALVFGSDGTLYMAGSTLYAVNTLTGAASAIGALGFQSGGDLAFIGGDLFMASSGNQLVEVDITTGAGTWSAIWVSGVCSGWQPPTT